MLNTNTEDLLDYEEEKFRNFSFKGNDFYYFTARIMGSFGGSAGLVVYHLVYNKNHHTVSTFTTFRVDGYIFLGDINGDDRLDFLNIENDGGYGADSINKFSINIYSCNNKTGNLNYLKINLVKNTLSKGIRTLTGMSET